MNVYEERQRMVICCSFGGVYLLFSHFVLALYQVERLLAVQTDKQREADEAAKNERALAKQRQRDRERSKAEEIEEAETAKRAAQYKVGDRADCFGLKTQKYWTVRVLKVEQSRVFVHWDGSFCRSHFSACFLSQTI